MNTAIRSAVALVTVTAAALAVVNSLSMKISDEIQPPGGVFQVKISLTEPKPISTGHGRLALTTPVISSIDAVQLLSPAGDAAGMAVISGTTVKLQCIIPSTTFGSLADSPIITIQGSVISYVALLTSRIRNGTNGFSCSFLWRS